LFASAAAVTPAINSAPQARPTCEANTPIVFLFEAGFVGNDMPGVLLMGYRDYILDFYGTEIRITLNW
jgi:hypothetical protein